MPFQGPADNWAMVEDTLDKSPVHHSSSQGRSVNMKVKLKCNGRCFRKERRMLNVKLITRLPDNSRKLTERKSLYSRMRINPKLYVSCLSIKPPWSLLVVVFYRILCSELKSGKTNKSGSGWDSLLLPPSYLFLTIFQTSTWKTLVLDFNCDQLVPAFSSKALSPLQM